MSPRIPLITGVVIFAGVLIWLVIKSSSSTAPPLSTGDINIPNSNSTTSVSPAPIIGRPQVEITTSKGKFIIEMRPDVAPKTVANFLAKFNSGYCVNLTFHRVENWVVQGCDPSGNGTGGKDSLPTENSKETFTTGAVGVARKAYPADISNDSQFFIVKTDSTFLDGQYTYFGKVISGMEIVAKTAIGDKILSTNVLTK